MSDKLLTTAEAEIEVRALRKNPSKNLTELNNRLKEQLKDFPCLVLGSAPHAILPSRKEFSRCLCVNGSPFIAKRHSIPVDLTVLIGFTTSMKKEISSISMEKLRGIHTKKLLFITAGDNIDNGSSELSQRGFTFDEALEIDPIERAAIIGEVCGEELGLGKRDDRISNGAFTIVLALWAGASNIIISGISLSGGHDYARDTPRYHLAGDIRLFNILSNRHPEVQTTSFELNKATGIPLYKKPGLFSYLKNMAKNWNITR